MYEKSLEVLEQDIWFLYEWLCSFHGGDGEAKFIERWSQDHTRCELGWTDIKEIVCYEEFAIEKNFIRSIPTYHNVLSTEAKDLNIIFKQLSHHNCFWPWARSFYDMHESLNTKGVVVYQQPRIVDNLIILTIRTEIVIRSIFSEWSEETQPDLKDIIKKASNSLAINDNEKKMLISIADNDWHLTDLRKMPEDVFQIIDDCETGAKNWGKKVCFIFKQILKFVTSRNYFAHNYYKDNDINQRSLFAKDILSACVDSLFYFNKILR